MAGLLTERYGTSVDYFVGALLVFECFYRYFWNNHLQPQIFPLRCIAVVRECDVFAVDLTGF